MDLNTPSIGLESRIGEIIRVSNLKESINAQLFRNQTKRFVNIVHNFKCVFCGFYKRMTLKKQPADTKLDLSSCNYTQNLIKAQK